MNNDLIFKPFLDIPIDLNPATNPTMIGAVSDANQFKRQLAHTLGSKWLTSLLIGGGAAAAMAAILMATGGTVITLPILGKIIIGATGWGTIAASSSATALTATGTHRAWHRLKRNKIEVVRKELDGSLDNWACFMAATVFRVYFENDPNSIETRFVKWGYAKKWADDALCILQRKDINIEDLKTKCTTKGDLEAALKQCGLRCDVITVDTMKRLIERR